MKKIVGWCTLCLGVVCSAYGQVDTLYIFNTNTSFGTLDLRIAKSPTRYYYLQEGITFSYRESPPGTKTNTYLPMNSWNTSAYDEGNMRERNGSSDHFVMNYRLLKPRGYRDDFKPGYPIIIMFHGAGEGANCWLTSRCYWATAGYNPASNNPPAPPDPDLKLLNNDRNLLHGGRQHLAAVELAGGRLPDDPNLPDRAFPGFVLFPQSMNGWGPTHTVEDAIRILRLLIKKYNIDPNRVYVHGLSNGGGAVYAAIKRAPWLFAAALPMSAVTDNGLLSQGLAEEVGKIPIWTFQGGQDTDPPPSRTANYVRRFREAGGNVRHYVYERLGHGTWNTAYNEPDFFSWILAQRKTNPNVYFQNTDICGSTGMGVKFGFARGFFHYEWERNGQIIAGATEAEYSTDLPGTYRGRFSRVPNPGPDDWEPWSDPIEVKEHNATAPEIELLTTTHLRGPGLPAAEEHNTVRLRAAEKAELFHWYKDGNLIDFSGTDVDDTLRYVSFTQSSASGNGAITLVTETSNCPTHPSEPLNLFFDNSAPQNFSLTPAGLNLKATPGDQSILLTWNDVTSQEEGYEIWRRSEGSTEFKFVARTRRNAVSYLDKPLASGVKYEYKLRGVSNSGRSNYVPSDDLNDNFVFTTETGSERLLAPSNLEVVANTLNTITLAWQPADNGNIREYRIYYGDKVAVTGDKATRYTLTGLPENTVFPIVVRAVDEGDNVSPPSNQVMGTTYVTGLTYKHSTGAWLSLDEPSLIATWDNPEFTGSVTNFSLDPATQEDYFNFEFNGYIFIETEGTYYFNVTSDDGSRLFIDGELIVDNDAHGRRTTASGPVVLSAGPHEIKVQYFDDVSDHHLSVQYRGPGIGDGSTFVPIPDNALRSGTYVPGTLPAIPSGLTVSAGAYVNLAWSYNGVASEFEVYRATTSDGPYRVITRTGELSTVDSAALKPGQEYYYKVRSVNNQGASNFTAAVSVVMPEDNTPPSAPEDVKVIGQSLTHIALQWTPSSDNVGVAYYEIYNGDQLIGTSEVHAYTAEGLEPEMEYAFTVKAVDASDNRSEASAELSVTTKPSAIFYSSASGDLHLLSSWARNEDGTGGAPENFSDNGQYFVIANRATATLGTEWSVTGDASRVVISEGVTVNASHALDANLELQENSRLVLNNTSAPNFVKVAPSATVEFVGDVLVPEAAYGHVVVSGPGNASFAEGDITVRGDLTLRNGAILKGANANATVIHLEGDLSLERSGMLESADNAVDLVLSEATHAVSSDSDFRVYRLTTARDTRVSVTSTSGTPVVIHVGSSEGGGLTLADGSVVGLADNTIIVEGAAVINPEQESGMLAVDEGTLVFNASGSLPSFVYFSPDQRRLALLEIGSTGGSVLHIASPVDITGRLKIRSGTLESQGNIRLRATENRTAFIDVIEGGGRIAGGVTVEQDLPDKGGITQYLSPSVEGVTVASWQETFPVTGSFTGASAGAAPSLFVFHNNKWEPYPPAAEGNTAPIEVGVGYAARMPGDGVARTLTTTGTPFQGETRFKVEGGDASTAWQGWTLIGNPYAAPIRWINNSDAWTRTGVANVIAVPHDTVVNGEVRTRIQYYDVELGGTVIDAGQAFFVRSYSESPALVIRENAKASAVHEVPESPEYIIVGVTGTGLSDEAYIVFSDVATDSFEPARDGRKLPNKGFPNIATLAADTMKLSVNHVSRDFCTKSLGLYVGSLTPGQWSLNARKGTALETGDVRVYDAYTGEEASLFKGDYTFVVNDDPGSYDVARFQLVIDRNTLNTSGPLIPPTTLCTSGSGSIVITKSQSDVVYEMLNGNGDAISPRTPGNGGALTMSVDVDKLQMGENTLRIRAGFVGCQSQVLPHDIEVDLVDVITVTAPSDTTVCEGRDVVLEASGTPPGGFYQWYDADGALIQGESSATLVLPDVNETVVAVSSALPDGCESERAQITVHTDTLTMPIVYYENDTLFTEVNAAYQWQVDDEFIPDATLAWYVPDKNGLYSVVATNGGCTKVSEAFQVGDLVTGVEDDPDVTLEVYPIPNKGEWMQLRLLSESSAPVRIEIVDQLGRLHFSETFTGAVLRGGVEIRPYAPLFEGLYFVRAIQKDGVSVYRKIVVK